MTSQLGASVNLHHSPSPEIQKPKRKRDAALKAEIEARADEIRKALRDKWGDPNKYTFLVAYLMTLYDADLPAATKWTGAMLALFGDWGTGKNCFPSKETLAAGARSTEESTIRRQLRQIEEAGLLQTSAGTGRKSSRYHLHIPNRTLTELADMMNEVQGQKSSIGVDAYPEQASTPTQGEHKSLPTIPLDQDTIPGQKTKSMEVSSLAIPVKYTDASRPDFQGAATGSELEDFQEMALSLKSLDDNRMLAPVLFEEKAYAELAALAKKCHVKFIEEAARNILYSSRIDGKMRTGGIRSWNYFAGKAMDYQRQDALYRAGLAPGDLTFLQKGLMSYE